MNQTASNLKILYEKVLLQNSEKKAIVFDGESMTYAELYKEANRFANALLKNGIKPNTPVALLMSNRMEYVVCSIGIIMAGAVKVPLNNMLGKKEINHILSNSGAAVVVAESGFLQILKEIKSNLSDLKAIVGLVSESDCTENIISWDRFQSDESEKPIEISILPDQIAMIMYTGGTTGNPKGVVHTHKTLLSNLYSHIIELELQEDEKILLTSPLPHSAGFIMIAGLTKGATHYIEKKFDPKIILNRIEEDKITMTFMVPTMINRFMDFVENLKTEYNLKSLRTLIYGASPITTERLKQGLKMFGPIFTQLYGQSEAPNFITRLRKSDHNLDLLSNEERLQSCGQAVVMARVKIVDELGKEVPRGFPGEIITQTPYNMIGYYKQDDITKATLKDDWLYTGDTGTMDELGYVYLLDRKKDIIITGGLNVYTTEVESVIQNYEGVSQVAVIGIPHSDWGEAVVAFVVPKNDTIKSDDILAYCKRELSSYKCPKEIKLVPSIPLTPYGKFDKKELRKPYWGNLDRQIN